MAQEEIIAVFKADIKEYEAQLRSLQKSLKDTEGAEKELLDQHEKRVQILREEVEDLEQLKKARDEANDPKEVSEYNKRINETKARIKDLGKAVGESGKQLEKYTQETVKSTEKTKELGKVGEKAFGLLDKLTFGLAGKMRELFQSVGTVTKGMNLLKTAIIGTGIGALVVLITSLVAYFTQTQRGADALKRAFAGLGAVVSVIVDRFSAFGEIVVSAFENPQQAVKDLWEVIKTNFLNRLKAIPAIVTAIGKVIKEGFSLNFKAAGDAAIEAGQAFIQLNTGLDTKQQNAFVQGLKDIGNEMATEAKAAFDLEQRLQDLRDAEINLSVEREKSRAIIKILNKDIEDTTKSTAERIKAAEKTLEIESALLAKQEQLAQERVNIIREQNLASEDLVEDKQRLADAEIELSRIQQESYELQTTLQNKLNILKAEGNRLLEAQKQKEKELLDFIKVKQDDLLDINFKAIEAQIDADQKALDSARRLAEEKERIVEEGLQKEIDAILAAVVEEDRIRDEQAQRAKELEIAQSESAQASLNTILNSAAQYTQGRISQLEMQYEFATGLRKKEIRDEIANQRFRLGVVKQAQTAILFIQEAAAVGKAYAELGPVVGTLAAVALGVKFALLFAQIEQQQFNKGTDYVMPANSKQGKSVDDIPAWLNKGEAVIPTKENLKNRGLVKSLVSGNADQFIQRNYVIPALQKSLSEGGNGGGSIVALLKDTGIVGATKNLERSQNKNFEKLIRTIGATNKVSRSRI